jgi:hypothetical protein
MVALAAQLDSPRRLHKRASDRPQDWLGTTPLLDLDDSKLRLKARSLVQLCRTDRDKALAIYRFVKRLPYTKRVKLQYPTARDVLEARGGDGDDKATLADRTDALCRHPGAIALHGDARRDAAWFDPSSHAGGAPAGGVLAGPLGAHRYLHLRCRIRGCRPRTPASERLGMRLGHPHQCPASVGREERRLSRRCAYRPGPHAHAASVRGERSPGTGVGIPAGQRAALPSIGTGACNGICWRPP